MSKEDRLDFLIGIILAVLGIVIAVIALVGLTFVVGCGIYGAGWPACQ